MTARRGSKTQDVSPATLERLPVYLRCLSEARMMGVSVINSVQLSDLTGVTPEQIRKDLSLIHELGTRGVGYCVEDLISDFRRMLHLETPRRIAIVGVGRLGSTFLNYPKLEQRGMTVNCVFDNDPKKIGTRLGDVEIQPMSELSRCAREERVDIAILSVPASAAQEAADAIVAAGIKAILNFVAIRLRVPSDVIVRQSDPVAALQVLSFKLDHRGV